jgi:hypothetical protein
VDNPIDGLTVLLVVRSDYVEVLEELALPKLVQDTNWKAVPPFTEQAARGFLLGSGLNIDDVVEREVLREAAEIEQTKGLIRPVTLNVCGLVLSRFAAGLPRGLRPGGMIRGFVRESVELPAIREVTPKVIPPLITDYVTKRPRTLTELATKTGLKEGTIRGCLRTLGQAERGIVRPLDDKQERWEISHDFLVPLLDATFARWSVSFWRRTRPFLPWIVAGAMVLAATSIRPKDPITELTELGWEERPQENDGIGFSFRGQPRWSKAAQAFRRLRVQPIAVEVTDIDTLAGMEALSVLKSPTSLKVISDKITDLRPLSSLKCLISLDILYVDEITDLGPLSGLKNLMWLNLNTNQITDLRPLGGLKSLTELFLRFNKITDLGPLNGLKNLTRLDLFSSQVDDLRPLSGLKNLAILDLSRTLVTDLSRHFSRRH